VEKNLCGEKMTNVRSAVMGKAINEKSTLRSEKKTKIDENGKMSS